LAGTHVAPTLASMVFKYAIHDGTNAALHSGPQGSKQPTAATNRRAEGRTTKRP
jgi:hypothetical protein